MNDKTAHLSSLSAFLKELNTETLDSQKVLSQQLANVQSIIVSQQVEWNKALKNIVPNVTSFIETLQKDQLVFQSTIRQWGRTVEVIAKRLENSKDDMRILSELGWYLDLDFDFIETNELARLARRKDFKSLDERLVKYYKHKADSIFDQLLKLYPSRRSVLRAGFKAHTEMNYYLSMPVFFAQVEGICFELTNQRFFAT